MGEIVKFFPVVILCSLATAGCTPSYSPNTYASNAVQLANKVDSGVVVGFREVHIAANGTIGAVTGGAAGGVLGSEYTSSAILAVGGAALGAAVGHTIDHAVGDTAGWEYIIRKANGDLLSVTQREKSPLPLGQKVLVINGPQARVIADYSMPAEDASKTADAKGTPKAADPVKVEVVLALPPGMSVQSAGGIDAATVSKINGATEPKQTAITAQNFSDAKSSAPVISMSPSVATPLPVGTSPQISAAVSLANAQAAPEATLVSTPATQAASPSVASASDDAGGAGDPNGADPKQLSRSDASPKEGAAP